MQSGLALPNEQRGEGNRVASIQRKRGCDLFAKRRKTRRRDGSGSRAETPANPKGIGFTPAMAGEESTRGSDCRVLNMAEIREN